MDMRVTSNSFPNTLVGELGDLSSRQVKLQAQVSSGQRIQYAEDDPTAMHQVMDMQSEAHSVSQYQTNVAHQQDLAKTSYTTIKSLNQMSSRANEIATLADGLKSPEELASYANEINEMIKQGVQSVNAKQGNNYLFGGTISDQPPFVLDSDPSGNVTAVNYQGNESVSQTEVSEGLTVTAQVVGASTSGSGGRGLITDSNSGADFFNHLIALRNDLTSGNVTAIASTDQAALQSDESNFLYHVSLNGSVQSRLDSTTTTLKDRAQSLNSQVANVASTDMAQTVVRLTQTQTAYQAALQSSSKILSLSLMDYLK